MQTVHKEPATAFNGDVRKTNEIQDFKNKVVLFVKNTALIFGGNKFHNISN